VCCSVLQCVAVCCSVLQCVAVCCRYVGLLYTPVVDHLALYYSYTLPLYILISFEVSLIRGLPTLEGLFWHAWLFWHAIFKRNAGLLWHACQNSPSNVEKTLYSHACLWNNLFKRPYFFLIGRTILKKISTFVVAQHSHIMHQLDISFPKHERLCHELFSVLI